MANELAWCEPDQCDAVFCGGPHVAIKTDLGLEIIPIGDKPFGTPIEEVNDD